MPTMPYPLDKPNSAFRYVDVKIALQIVRPGGLNLRNPND